MFKLTSGTDVASHTIFDPLALKGYSEPTPGDLIYAYAKRGDALTFTTHADGTEEIWVYVDETPEPSVLERACVGKLNGVLRVPSGTLWAAGQEFATGAESAEAAKAWKIGFEHMGTRVEIPPGEYRVDAYVHRAEIYDVRVSELITQKLTPKEVSRLNRDETLFGAGIVLTVLGVASWMFGVSKEKKFFALEILVSALVVMWGLMRAIKDKSVAAKARQIGEEYEASVFSALLVLKKADGPISADDEGIVLDSEVVLDLAEAGAQK